MNVDRIKAAQDEIGEYLPDRDEYVVNTSDFEEVKQRLASLNSRHLGGGKRDPSRPVLLRRSSSSGSGSTAGPKDDGSTTEQKDDGRPTLKRTPSN